MYVHKCPKGVATVGEEWQACCITLSEVMSLLPPPPSPSVAAGWARAALTNFLGFILPQRIPFSRKMIQKSCVTNTSF